MQYGKQAFKRFYEKKKKGSSPFSLVGDEKKKSSLLGFLIDVKL